MMVITFLMAATPSNIVVHTYVGQVTIRGFPTQADCEMRARAVALTDFDTMKHSVSVVCQPQPR